MTAVWLLASAATSDTQTPVGRAFRWEDKSVLLNGDGNFVSAPSGGLSRKSDRQSKTRRPSSAGPTRFTWRPIEELPILSDQDLSRLLQQPVAMQASDRSLLVLPSIQARVYSPLTSRPDEQTVRLDNQLLTARESALHVRYRASSEPSSPLRDLVIVTEGVYGLYSDYLADSPHSGAAANLIGILQTPTGRFVVFETRLGTAPTTELELVGGGLSNGILSNLARVSVQHSLSGGRARIIVGASKWEEYDNIEGGSEYRTQLQELLKQLLDQAQDSSKKTIAVQQRNWPPNTSESMLASLGPAEWFSVDLIGDGGIVMSGVLPDASLNVILEIPEAHLKPKGVTFFTLVVHHPWGRDFVRPVAVVRQ